MVGNRDYEDRDIPDVSYAHRDADAFRRYVVEVLGFNPENIIDLRDARRRRMFDVLGTRKSHQGELWSYLDPDGGSDVVVFYSGHGVPGLKDKRGYLLPVDGSPNAAEDDGYPIDLLYGNLGKLEEARSVVVYLDACFSGASPEGNLTRSASPVYVRAALTKELSKKVTALTAATGKQLASWDNRARHGLFTHHLLDALYGKGDGNKDGRVTAEEAKEYLDRRMTRAARRQYRRIQHASLSGAGGVVLSAAASGGFPERPSLDGGSQASKKKKAVKASKPPVVKKKGKPLAGIVLPDGITLADWVLLAEEQLKSGEHVRLLAEAKAHLRVYGSRKPVESVLERAVSGLVKEVRALVEQDARAGLSRIGRLEASAGKRPSLVRLKVRAYGLLGDLRSQEGALVEWLGLAPQSHPERAEVLKELFRVRSVMRAVAVEEKLGLGQEARALVQGGLASLGLYGGSVDGAFGERTREAIRAFQKGKGHKETGRLTKGQAERLVALGERAEAERRVREKAERERKAREVREARERAERERKAKAKEARERMEAERRARERAAREAREAREKAERERKAREARERMEAERKAQIEALYRRWPAGKVFRDCQDCPQMVVIPVGSFMMGSPPGEKWEKWEVESQRPRHRVTIAKPFAVSKYEVTFAEWDACVRDGGCEGYRPDNLHWGRGRRPVIYVTWSHAKAYVRWLSLKTGKKYRLLSESEWEYAARAGSTTQYSWGDDIGHNRANCRGCGSQWDDNMRTAPVGSFSANRFGLHDMHGNVWEWVEDCWNKNYRYAPTDGRAWTDGDCSQRVLRGGSWSSTPGRLRSASRGWYGAGFRGYIYGFRVARTLSP